MFIWFLSLIISTLEHSHLFPPFHSRSNPHRATKIIFPQNYFTTITSLLRNLHNDIIFMTSDTKLQSQDSNLNNYILSPFGITITDTIFNSECGVRVGDWQRFLVEVAQGL